MAVLSGNQLFPIGREGFLQGTFTWDSDTWNICLNDDTDDTPMDTDDFLDDFVAAAIVDSATETSNEIGSPTSTDNVGTADGNDVTMTAVSNAEAVERLIIYREIGGSQATPADDELLVHIDSATGLPITPNTGDITVQWDSGTDKIFTL